ncbi:UDP-N-acetylmuramate dehydrogenase [Marmoricola sp. RAF53]|uniref:UDP-N-acetylmuramate dehydrogenase n=1 Tax=Marmoricola sp. RAF53 TaxID=3233059 RepID=UPI003F9DE292
MPDLLTGVRLADHTTLRVGGPAAEFVTAGTETDLVDAVRAADADGTPVLVVGGGSNLLVDDAGFDGRVVAVRTTGISADADACGGAVVRVAAGESWDGLAERAVEEGWIGAEALAGIPGLVGATPIQNVGAYGQEVAESIASVRCWDREAGAVRTLFNRDCRFGYRSSRFKSEPQRWVVLEVVFQFRLGDVGAPVKYAELAARLGVEPGGRAPARDVREAVLALRRGKGMVLDAADHDTWSAGSFFTNPVVAPDLVPDGAPAWPQPDGTAKTSAAWLIEQAGFGRGYGNDRAALSGKHTLALTNRGGASSADLLALAAEVRDGVRERFGITLVNEPVLIGCAL